MVAGEILAVIAEHSDSIIGIGTFNVKLSIIVNNTSKYGIMVYKYEGGDWTDRQPDNSFEIKPYSSEVQSRHNQESEWAEEFRVAGNGWGIVGEIDHTYYTDRSGDKLWNTVHFSIPGYPETSCMALWTLVHWEDRELKVEAKLGFTNQFNDLNSENCPLRQQNLVNENVGIRVSRGRGPNERNLELTFEGDYFGKFEW